MVNVVGYINHPTLWDETDPENRVVITMSYREKTITPTYHENVQPPRPTYSVEDRDENGNGLGTYHQQGMGIIA